MATPDSVKAKIQGLIDKANGTTGGADTDLTAAVDALLAGYGQGEEAVLTELTASENGEYTPEEGVDGFSKVTVSVPVMEGTEPVLEELTITENGEYTPGDGVDGFSKVIANIIGGSGSGAVLLESGTIASTASTTQLIQELSETPDLVMMWAETEITSSATAGCVIAVLPITILPTDTTPTGAISNFTAVLRYLNGNITNNGEASQSGIYLSNGVPFFKVVRISSSYPLIDGNYVYKTYKLWKEEA